MAVIFKDRKEAGKLLAELLMEYASRPNTIVLALPRGGVPVAFEVAQTLRLPLDVLLVRKLGVPGQEELAFGAIASGGAVFINNALVNGLRLSDAVVDKIIERERGVLAERDRLYRGSRPPIDLSGKTVIIIDDGLATGATMRVAIGAVKRHKPGKVVVAVPVGAKQTCDEFGELADTVCVCAQTPEPFYAVGLWYHDFSQTTDDEVRELLSRANGGLREARQHVA